MSRQREDLSNALRRPTAGPPTDLAQRIKDAIPNDLGDDLAEPEVVHRAWQPARWAAAASIFVALGAGVVGWRLLQGGVRPENVVFEQASPEQPVPSRQATQATVPKVEALGGVESTIDRDRILGGLDKAPGPAEGLADAVAGQLDPILTPLAEDAAAPRPQPAAPRQSGQGRAPRLP